MKFLMHYNVYCCSFSTKSMHSDINSNMSGLLHLIDQPNSKKGRAARVKDGIISETIFFWLYQLIDTLLGKKLSRAKKLKQDNKKMFFFLFLW